MRFSWQVYWGGLPFPAPGWLWDLDHKEGRTPKNWCCQTVVLEKTPESPLDSKEIKPVNLKGDLPWIFTGRTDAETNAPVFWSSDANRQLTGKVSDAWKIEGRRRRGCQRMRWTDGSPMQQTWTWANSGRWWGAWRRGELLSMGLQRVRHDWVIEQQQGGEICKKVYGREP